MQVRSSGDAVVALVRCVAVVAWLAPMHAGAQCDAESVRTVVSASPEPLARLLRAHPEPDQPERWRAGPVTIGAPEIAPILAGGCSGALVAYTWTTTDPRTPTVRRWRHAVAVLAVRGGRLRIVARRALASVGDDEPPHHDVRFEPDPEGVVVVSIGGAGWGSEQRYRVVGRRLVRIDGLRVGRIAH